MAQAKRKTTRRTRKAAKKIDEVRARELQVRLYKLSARLPEAQDEFDAVREELERVMAGEA